MERQAQAAEALMANSTGQDALNHAIQAVDLFMAAAKQAPTKADAARLRRKCGELIAHAELLKANLASESLSPQETILRNASCLHGNEFPQWKTEPRQEDFQSYSDDFVYQDDTVFTLSPMQSETFVGWLRPRELFRPDEPENSQEPPDTMFMDSCTTPDLVQDMTTDCSVVAGLSAAIRILTGKHSILPSIIYPFDHVQGRPNYSERGKYILRLNFNGCSRRVVIDDRLPASSDKSNFFVVDRANPRLLWPALLEKAYLKVRGGYDFPGSNSGTDLWVLTGWIPEQVFLQKEDLDINEVWARIKTAHDSLDVVITIGTGFISSEEEKATGLVGEHDYAIQSVDESGGERRLLVKNPWCGSKAWTPALFSASTTLSQPTDPEKSTEFGKESPGDGMGCLWVTLEDVAQNFESMYLNWNPRLFQHRLDYHFEWKMPTDSFTSSVARNPQYAIYSPAGGLVWVLVSRHFADEELEILRQRTPNLAAASRQLGFMSIMVFDSKGKRVQVDDGETYRGPYVDSPQTLARLNTTPGKWYTIVVDQQELPLSKYTFTLSTFSHSPFMVEEASEAMPYAKEVLSCWKKRTAGGSATCATYFLNPQYSISVPSPTPMSILICSDAADIHIHVDLVWGHGKRVSGVKVKDLVGSSGEYRRGWAVAEIPHADPGTYTIVCSTFEAGQVGNFGVRVTSKAPISMEPIPPEAAGRLRTHIPGLKLSQTVDRVQSLLSARWLTRASVVVNVDNMTARTNSRCVSTLLIRMSIVLGRGHERLVIATSGNGEFQPATSGLRIPEFDMDPERAGNVGMWLLVEGMGLTDEGHTLDAYVFSDFPIQTRQWEPVGGTWD